MEPSPPRRTPDPDSRFGAVLYAVAGGLIVALILVLAHHIHLVWSWNGR